MVVNSFLPGACRQDYVWVPTGANSLTGLVSVLSGTGPLLAQLSSVAPPTGPSLAALLPANSKGVLTLDQMEGIKDASKPCWTSEAADSADPPRLWMPDALYPGTAFTRSLGDAAAERIGVIPDPEVRPRALTPSDRFLILASDGVWEFMSNQDAVDLVASEEARGDPQRACVLLCVEAYRRWLRNETRTDDITAAVLWFDGEPGSSKRKNDSSVVEGAASAEDGGSTVAAAIQRASMVRETFVSFSLLFELPFFSPFRGVSPERKLE